MVPVVHSDWRTTAPPREELDYQTKKGLCKRCRGNGRHRIFDSLEVVEDFDGSDDECENGFH